MTAPRESGAARGIVRPGQPRRRRRSTSSPARRSSARETYEVRPAPDRGEPANPQPVHTLLLIDHGVYLLESLDLETIAAAGVREFCRSRSATRPGRWSIQSRSPELASTERGGPQAAAER